MLHQQLANQICDQVAVGLLREGERLDTIAEVERQLHLSHATVSKAYAVLQERGVIETGRRKGSVIAPIPRSLRDQLRQEYAERTLRPVIRELHLAGLMPEQMLLALNNIVKRARLHFTNGVVHGPDAEIVA